eukprot:6460468-Amphidinium_carterae.1
MGSKVLSLSTHSYAYIVATWLHQLPSLTEGLGGIAFRLVLCQHANQDSHAPVVGWEAKASVEIARDRASLAGLLRESSEAPSETICPQIEMRTSNLQLEAFLLVVRTPTSCLSLHICHV